VDNKDIKIDKGIPLPNDGRLTKYPFKGMKIGDSFLFPEETTPNNAYSLAISAGVRLKLKFSVRKTSEGYRCWRIA
jgi:hypothetical protein